MHTLSSLPLCLISLLFPICSTHYVIKAINLFMEQLFHVAMKHTETTHMVGKYESRSPKDQDKMYVSLCALQF